MKASPSPTKPAVEVPRSTPGEWSEVPATKPKPFRPDLSHYGCAALVGAAGAIVLFVAGYCAYAWYDFSRPPGQVPFAEWPLSLRERHAQWTRDGADLDGMQVYVALQFIDTESYCRVRYTPETWEYFKNRYGGAAEASPDLARPMWEEVRRELPEWAPNLDNPNVELLPIEPFRDGEHVRLAYDPGRQMIYINYGTIF